MANMDSNQIASTLIQSMNSIADNAVKKSGFDKTIEAIIIECKDPTLGKYKVKYQDAIFFAYSTNVETKYSNNSVVYITVPNGDMSKDKTIIGTKEHLGTTFNTILQKSQKYIKVGYKKIAGQYALHSYEPNGDSNIILNTDSISNTQLQTYMKEGNAIYLSAKIRTDLDTDQKKSKGHYQLCVSMQFVSNADKNVTKVYNYILDEGSVQGNPYSLSGAVQTQFFEINNDNQSFNQIKEIKILSSGFNSNEDKQNIQDIFFSDIEIGSAYKLSNDQLSGEFLNLNTPSGAFLNDSHNSLSIQSQIRIKGQIVDKDSNNIQYYWFRENAKITNQQASFCPYGQQGWECLNETVKLNDNNVQFITNKPSITLYQSGEGADKRFECIAAQTRFKCVVIYCGSVKLSKQIIIHNSKSDYEINITTNSGNTIFYFDNGSTDLICNVYQKSTQTTVPNITYVWSVVSAAGDFTQLSETTNTIKNIKISSIVNFATYQCSIFDSSGIFLGSNSIKVVNSLQKNYQTYSLTIVGGDKVFKYDTNGYSPSNSKYYIDPIAIEDLTFKLYNQVGVEIDQQLISEKAEITWRIPSQDTLLKNIYIGDNISNPYVADEETAANKGYICLSKTKNLDNNKDKLLKLPIAIEDMFSMKSNRDIYLIVDYNGHHVVTKTNFVFTKEGMNGNNGTEYTCSVRPIIDSSVQKVPENPTIYLYRNEDGTIASKKCNWRESLEDGSDWFKVTLYKNGQDIINSGASNINVTWSILKSKSNDVSFLSCVRNTNGAYQWSINNNFVFTDDNMDSISPSNIVEAKFSYDKTSFSGTLPINFVILPANSTNLINFKQYTGFTEVMYNRFQVKPQYRDQYPFTIQVTGSDNVTFSNKILPDSSFLSIKEENKCSNYYQIKLNPKAEYDGYNVNISLEVIVENIGRIFIPIHFMINRYFSSVLNGWNGNSIQLGDNKEGMILAPQVAAGKKNNDNTFTGIVLGTQKDRDGSKTGLFGYNTGKQSIFLDANNGSAIFGIEDEGRIEFIPGKSAVIKSGNYNEKDKTGMQIDLSKPFIKYGSGNFSVNQDGILSAQGIKVSGTIRGSSIYGAYIASDDSNNPSFSLNKNGTITGATIRGSNIYGAYIASDNSNNPSFSLNSSGKLYANDATIIGDIDATNITIKDKLYMYSSLYTKREVLNLQSAIGEDNQEYPTLIVGKGLDEIDFFTTWEERTYVEDGEEITQIISPKFYFSNSESTLHVANLWSDGKIQADGSILTYGFLRYSMDSYNNTSTGSTNVRLCDIPKDGVYSTLKRTTSSSKFKLDIQPIQQQHSYVYNILKLQPMQWFDKGSIERYAEALTKEQDLNKVDVETISPIYGLIAQDVQKAGLSQYCEYNSSNEIIGLQYDRLWTLLIPIVKDHQQKIQQQQQQIQELQSQIKRLKGEK